MPALNVELALFARVDLVVSTLVRTSTIIAGSPVAYTISVINDGPQVATNIILSGEIPDGTDFAAITPSQGTCTSIAGEMTCELTTIEMGSEVLITVVLDTAPTIRGALAGSVDVIAQETDLVLDNNASRFDLLFAGQADLSLQSGTSTPRFNAGEKQTYTLEVYNFGPSTAMDVVLSDTLPEGVTLLSITSDRGQCDNDGIAITCTWPIIQNMEGESVLFDVVVPNTSAALKNTAAVTALEPDPQPNDNSSILETPVDWGADISVGMSASPPEIKPGGTFTYTLNIDNRGPWPATELRMLVPVTAGMRFTSATTTQGDCYILTEGVRCNLGQLARDASAFVTIVGIADITGGTLATTATIIASEPDPNPSENSFTVAVKIQPVADISVSVISKPDSVAPGDELKYTIVIRNDGPLTASGVTLVDTMPSGVTLRTATSTKGHCSVWENNINCELGLLSNGVSEEVTIVVIVTADAHETLLNTAKVSAVETDVYPQNNERITETPLDRCPSADIAIITQLSTSPPVIGQIYPITVIVANAGPLPATEVTVTDFLDETIEFLSISSTQGDCIPDVHTVSCWLGTLEPETSAEINLWVELTQFTTGMLVNTAVVEANEFDPQLADNSTTVMVHVLLTQTPTATPTPIKGVTPIELTLLPTAVLTAIVEKTPTSNLTPTPTFTSVPTPTATATPAPTPTNTRIPIGFTPTPKTVPTVTVSTTPTPDSVPTPSPTYVPTLLFSPTPTATLTSTLSPSPTSTSTPMATNTPSPAQAELPTPLSALRPPEL